MTTARRYQPHYTVEDYRQWEGRWELWAGVAVAMSPSPLGRHAKLLGRLVAALGNSIEAAGCAATVLVGPEPEGHVEAAPALVFEVLSEATRDRDVVFKRSLYEAQGVPTYLIADPEQRTLHVLSLGTDGRYVGSLGDATAMPPVLGLCRDCQITLDPAWLFR
jgi:Uma2 family endonuclease